MEQTMKGMLAKLLQDMEDRIVNTIGFRNRMVELRGSKLCQILLITNPLTGKDCCRKECVAREENTDWTSRGGI